MDRADKFFLAGLLLALAAVAGMVIYQNPYETWPQWWPWAAFGYAVISGPALAAAWWLGRPD